MSDTCAPGECASLQSVTSFASYVGCMRNVTSQDLAVSAMTPCRQPICSALYGTGNADISGIGVIIGYFMELFLGLLLGVGITVPKHRGSRKGFLCAVHRAFGVYADAAILLTFSVQLASFIILIKKDFGISARDFGGLTVEVTWTAALLTMLPMLLVSSSGADLDRKELRLSVICISWIFFLYTFISRMISTYGPSQVGLSQPAVISPLEAANIEQLCSTAGSNLSKQETVAFEVFAIGGSLSLSIVLVGTLIMMLLHRRQADLVRRWKHSGNFTGRIFSTTSTTLTRLLMVFNIFLWGIPQLWAILRFRAVQQVLAGSISTPDQDNSWSFGQIVAVVIFLPVLLEFVYVYLKGFPEVENKANGSDSGVRGSSHHGTQNGMTFQDTI